MLILEQIPMRKDNYSYAIIKDNDVIMIDPSEENESVEFFKNRPNLSLKAILNTHGHSDHVGGNEVLYKKFKCPIFGPKVEKYRIPHLEHELVGGEKISLLGINIFAYDVHAHTLGHMAFLIDQRIDEIIKRGHGHSSYVAKNLSGHRVMFVGDSLFAAGCGRLFEGTPHDLAKVLSFYAKQDPDILMACAHEYTQSNLNFAQHILPGCSEIETRNAAIKNLLDQEGSSVPCFFELEHVTNPFLLAVKAKKGILAEKFSVPVDDLPAIVGALRHAKDVF